MPVIVPTVFCFDRLALEERLERYEGLVDRIQLDVADTNFASQQTLDVDMMVEQPTSLKRDVHLMVAEPVEWLEKCHEEAVDMAIGQIESMSSQAEYQKLAENLGIKWGLAIDIDTKVEDLDWDVAKDCNQILVMTVRAGKEGQKLDPKALDKVRAIRDKGFTQEICVDGGVNAKTIETCVKAGADVLAVGSSLGLAENPAKVYQELKALAEKYAL